MIFSKKQAIFIPIIIFILILSVMDIVIGIFTSFRISILISIATIILSFLFVIADKNRNNLSFFVALLIYTVATQYGLVICYFFFGENVLLEYNSWTINFLYGHYIPYLIKSLSLANTAVICYTIMGIIGSNRANHLCKIKTVNDFKLPYDLQRRKCGTAACVMFTSVLLYFIIMIVTGQFSITMTYSELKESSMIHTTLFRYILIIYSCASVYMIYSDEKKIHICYLLWGLIASMLLITGNKGEVLYPLLAAAGAIGIKDGKIKKQYIIIALSILFIVIPSITSLRTIGIARNLSQVGFSFTDSFVEMGMQIRTSVYTLEKMRNGALQFVYGKSYYQPLINILGNILFFIDLPHETVQGFIGDYITGGGYSQVIESYVNFGVFGTMFYFSLCGYFLSNGEKKSSEPLKLCLLGTITSVLINASRNYFRFVPGQILVVCFFYFIIVKIKLELK